MYFKLNKCTGFVHFARVLYSKIKYIFVISELLDEDFLT